MFPTCLFSISAECMADSFPDEQFYDCLMSPELESLSIALNNFASVQSTWNPTFAFWFTYLEMLQILLLFIRATRVNNWELHLSDLCFLGSLWLIELIMQELEQCTGWKCHVWITLIQVKCLVSVWVNCKVNLSIMFYNISSCNKDHHFWGKVLL